MILILWFISFFTIGWWIADVYFEYKSRPKKIKLMTQKADLALWLLQGNKVSIMDGFKLFGITNIPREIGRSIERLDAHGFGVTCERKKKEGTTRGGEPCHWMEYRLLKTKENEEGIERMKKYIQSQMISNPKTDAEAKVYKQAKLILQ